MDDNKSNQPTPEQLIKILELQMEAGRKSRSSSPPNNRMILWGSLVAVILTALGLLYFMLAFLEELKSTQKGQKPSNKTQQTKF